MIKKYLQVDQNNWEHEKQNSDIKRVALCRTLARSRRRDRALTSRHRCPTKSDETG